MSVNLHRCPKKVTPCSVMKNVHPLLSLTDSIKFASTSFWHFAFTELCDTFAILDTADIIAPSLPDSAIILRMSCIIPISERYCCFAVMEQPDSSAMPVDTLISISIMTNLFHSANKIFGEM